MRNVVVLFIISKQAKQRLEEIKNKLKEEAPENKYVTFQDYQQFLEFVKKDHNKIKFLLTNSPVAIVSASEISQGKILSKIVGGSFS